jgi:hypothetical protein
MPTSDFILWTSTFRIRIAPDAGSHSSIYLVFEHFLIVASAANYRNQFFVELIPTPTSLVYYPTHINIYLVLRIFLEKGYGKPVAFGPSLQSVSYYLQSPLNGCIVLLSKLMGDILISIGEVLEFTTVLRLRVLHFRSPIPIALL